MTRLLRNTLKRWVWALGLLGVATVGLFPPWLEIFEVRDGPTEWGRREIPIGMNWLLREPRDWDAADEPEPQTPRGAQPGNARCK
jgi:hypothetical protein